MRRILAVAVGGGFMGTGLYLILGAALYVGPWPIKTAALIACLAVGAFLVNMALDELEH